MSYVNDIFGSSTDLDESFEGFSITGMTKTKKVSSGKQPQKQTGAGIFPEQVPIEPRAERATSQDGGNADGEPDKSTSESDPALPPVHMDPTPQMREMSSLGISNDILRRFVHLESLVEMIAMHVSLVEQRTQLLHLKICLLLLNVPHPLELKTKMFMKMKPHLQCLPGRKENWPNPLVVNLIVAKTMIYFFLPPRSSPKTFPVDDSVSKFVSSCFDIYLKEDDFDKVRESDLKPDIDFFQAPIVNSTIKDKISDPGMLRGDRFTFKFRSQLISGANGILNLWKHIKYGKDLSHADVLETLQRSLVLIGSSFAGSSSFRRHRFKSSLSPEFQSLVKEPEGGFSPSKFLFGDDLSSKIKSLSEENKLIRKITIPRKQLPQKFKPQYRARQQSAKTRFSNRRVIFK